MTVIWGSTMFVSPDGRRFHCLFYVEATHWTLVSRSLPLNSSPGCSLSAVDRHQVVWFVYLIKSTPKKEQSFLTRDVNLNCASHLVFLQAVINVSVCPCCVSPPRQGETPPLPKRHLYSQHTSSHLCGPSAERLITWCVCVSLQGAG